MLSDKAVKEFLDLAYGSDDVKDYVKFLTSKIGSLICLNGGMVWNDPSFFDRSSFDRYNMHIYILLEAKQHVGSSQRYVGIKNKCFAAFDPLPEISKCFQIKVSAGREVIDLLVSKDSFKFVELQD